MYGSVVEGLDRKLFHGLNAAQRRDLYFIKTGKAFPTATGQLLGSIEAVFKSWNNERAKIYRKMNGIPDTWGTAVTVQAMVFGNLNDDSGTGVLFTRNPDSGHAVVTGEFLTNAQGEDVVAGIRTPIPLTKMVEWNSAVADELRNTVLKLEHTKRDVQDVEFTIQDKKLYILQTRNAKRSARAAIRIAMDMLDEKLIDAEEVLRRVKFKEYLLATAPGLDPTFKTPPFATGLPACSGVVTGMVVHTSKAAEASKAPCILVTNETTPDDIGGMVAALGLLTMTGGATSHAAVVARSMNKACVVGLGKAQSDFPVGSVVSIDGATGRVWQAAVPVVSGAGDDNLKRFEALVLSATPKEKVVTCNDRYLDFGGWAPGPALKLLGEVLASKKPEKRILVSTVPHCGSEASSAFAKVFGIDPEAVLVKALRAAHEEVITLYSSPHLEGGLQSIARVTTLKELVEAQDLVLMDFKPEKWEEKLVNWKMANEPVTAISIGAVVPNCTSYVSQLELIRHALDTAKGA